MIKKKLGFAGLIYILIASILAVGGSFIYKSTIAGAEASSKTALMAVFYVVFAVGAALFLFSSVSLLNMIREKKVTEFAFHIMRFAIIIITIFISLFVILENDFGERVLVSRENETKQLAVSTAISLRSAIGESVQLADDDGAGIAEHFSYLTEDIDANGRTAALFLLNENGSLDKYEEQEMLTPNKELYYVAGSRVDALMSSAEERAREVAENKIILLTKAEAGETSYDVVSAPVYSSTGRLVGVLEIYDNLNAKAGLELINFPLIIIVSGAFILLLILFYTLSSLVDVLLRPRRFIVSPAFKHGNEVVRSISVLIFMCSTMPLCPIFFDFSKYSAAVFGGVLPDMFIDYIPLIIYMVACILGSRIGGLGSKKLVREIAAIGAVISAVGFTITVGSDNPTFAIAGIAAGGFGYGIASRVIDRYRVYGRYSSEGDDKVIYSPYLGIAAGAVFGAFLYERGGGKTLFVTTAAVVILVGIMAMLLFKNTSCESISREGDEDFLNEAYTRKSVFGRFGILAVTTSLVLSFGWFYLTVYLGSLDISKTAITFGFVCIILGGGVVGNLYREASTFNLRVMFGLSGIFLAASLIPFAIAPSEATAVAAYFLMVIGEILGHGTINAYLTQGSNSKDRIGFWGQGNLLLELVSIGSVVGGVVLLNMSDITIPMVIIALIVAAIGTANLVMIVGTKPIPIQPALMPVPDSQGEAVILNSELELCSEEEAVASPADDTANDAETAATVSDTATAAEAPAEEMTGGAETTPAEPAAAEESAATTEAGESGEENGASSPAGENPTTGESDWAEAFSYAEFEKSLTHSTEKTEE
ncbi:MAG: MFS transporter [Oscillospiraceae bacterium]|nr:MFS transporter [Oscillospiraceae bacterium]